MKNVLIISYYWPPAGGPGVQRVLKFAKYLPDFGWNPILLIPQNPDYPNYDKSHLKDVESIRSIRHNFFEPHSFYKKLKGMKSDEGITSTVLTDKSTSFLDRISKWIRLNLFLPDARCGWIFSKQKDIRKIFQTEKIDLIFSSGPPHSTHILANKWGQRMKIPTINDLRDPWTDFVSYQEQKRFFLSSFIDKQLEKRTLKKAAKIVVISPSMKKNFHKLLPESNVELITNGFDSEDFPPSNSAFPEEFLWTYTGNLDKNRVPYAFLEACHKLQEEGINIKCQFIGRQCSELSHEIKRLNLEKQILLEGFLAHTESIKKLQESVGLILIIDHVPNNESFLTGKIFEYIGAKKYILGIGPVRGDAAQLLEVSQAGKIFDYNDSESIYLQLKKQYSFFLEKRTFTNHSNKYERRKLTESLSLLFDGLSR